MKDNVNKKRILCYLIFSFGISWTTGLTIYLTGGLENSPTKTIDGTQISLAYLLLATAYMFGPAIANLLTRLLTKEGKADLFLQPHFDKKRWVYFLAGWLLPGLLTIIGMILFFGIFPGFFDTKLSSLTSTISAAGDAPNLNPWLIAIYQTLLAIIFSPIPNAISTFGEEFGWRGYLQPKLMHLGGKKAVLLTGLIWGVWHWPIILMGYNYGMDYFGAPFLGLLAMVWFTTALSVIFGWVTIKGGNVWPAVVAHGALNGIAALGALFVKENPDSLLGPTPVGIIGGLGFTIAAVLILICSDAFKTSQTRSKY